MNTILTNLGLTQNETAVYLAYIKYAEKTSAEIARIIRMDKFSCYRAVETLIHKRLIITIQKKEAHYIRPYLQRY